MVAEERSVLSFAAASPADFRAETARVAFAVFIPVSLLLLLILGIYLCFLR